MFFTALSYGGKKKAVGKGNALEDKHLQLCWKPGQPWAYRVPTSHSYKWIFCSCVTWDRGSYRFPFTDEKWNSDLFLEGLVRADTWNAFCCRAVQQDYEEQRKNKAITLKNTPHSPQWCGITQQAWDRGQNKADLKRERLNWDSSWDWEQLKLAGLDVWTFAEQQQWFGGLRCDCPSGLPSSPSHPQLAQLPDPSYTEESKFTKWKRVSQSVMSLVKASLPSPPSLASEKTSKIAVKFHVFQTKRKLNCSLQETEFLLNEIMKHNQLHFSARARKAICWEAEVRSNLLSGVIHWNTATGR